MQIQFGFHCANEQSNRCGGFPILKQIQLFSVFGNKRKRNKSKQNNNED